MSILQFPFARTRVPTQQSALPPVQWGLWNEANHRQRYDLLRAYASNNGLYAPAARARYEAGTLVPDIRGLRTVAARVIEFHAAHLWPGTLPDALPIETDHAVIVEPIQQVWTWSNWDARKQVAARWLAMLGDLFIKVRTNDDRSRVFFELIAPESVTDFEADERGFITFIRLDVKQTDRTGSRPREVVHTEVWDKQQFRLWVHDKGLDEELDRLGTPRETTPLSAFGIDFVPFVHAKFRDIGEDRGQAAIWPALEKQDDANLQATRLSQLLFRHNNVNWALGGMGNDAAGRPLPPPTLGGSGVTASGDPDTYTVGGERFFRLPGNAKLESLIPQLNYDAARAILADSMLELEHDLPELAYARITEQSSSQLSGRAIRFMLTPAIDRALEARANAEAALIRADQMALTIGEAAGLFRTIGSFDSGDFEHRFADRPVVPIDDSEEATALETRARAAMELAPLLPEAEQLKIAQPEWDDARIKDVIAAKRAETPESLQLADAFAEPLGGRQQEGA